MRKSVQNVLIALVVVLVGATVFSFFKYRQATADYSRVKAAEESTRERYAQSIQAIIEIQDSLNSISLGDTTVHMMPGNLQAEQDLTDPNATRALERIAALRESIDRTKTRINQLEEDLKASGVKAAGLNRLVANLRKTVAEKEQYIAGLTGQVDSLQTQVAGLTTTVEATSAQLQARSQELEDTQRRLATVYYVIGSKKDLTDAGVVEAHGGLLGIGKTLQPSPSASEAQFTALDTDFQRVLPISSPRAKVVSAQPAASYELRTTGNGLELHILDPEQFRKVKQVIIVTA